MVRRIVDEKYIVFNREEFDFWHLKYLSDIDICEPVRDAVVIRKQDVFAPPALDAYANAILVVVEALKVTGSEPGLVPRLLKISDYFRLQAEDAYDMQRKLPD
ncbi:MAG: hypothetical protein DMF62_04695 [Acidobacteria bacterium]|nr:MAG: hypothetical protein DMF62_04695 [Acidobacteriota bacterium]